VDEHTGPWGIKVTAVETKDIELPEGMKRAMAKQAEAERERRAKVISAEGEFQAATKLTQAGKMMAEEPISLQLRYLQTLAVVAAENNSTTLFSHTDRPVQTLYGACAKEGEIERKCRGAI